MRISGESGDGIITLGEVFCRALVKSGYEILTFRTFPAEVRGGLTMFQVRFDREKVLSQGDDVDLLLVFNEESYHKEIADLKEGGTLLYDSDAFEPEGKEGFGLPLSSLSKTRTKGHGKNILALGALADVYSLDLELVEEVLRARFEGKDDLIQLDVNALRLGHETFSKTLLDLKQATTTPHVKKKRLLLSGNEAICLGAMAGGMRFFAGYPITPASDILEFLATDLPGFGGAVVQTEDELAALGSAIGASFAGKKAMTATSGPGISLMAELIGYASMAEIPVVIVDCQRGGPSTGLPTKTEQSDLAHSVFGGHGEAPRIVLAPSTVEECFYMMIKAFNMAEELQMPVVLLSDQSLSHRLESVDMLDTGKVVVKDRVKPAVSTADGFKRYELTDNGVSPMPVPGENDMLFITTGIEHNESGLPDYDPINREKMVGKRHRKLKTALRYSEVVTHGDPDAELKLVSWGSTEGAVREAVERANEKGIRVASVHPKLLYPLPRKELSEFLEGAKKIIVPEVNHTGQFAMLLRSELNIEVHGFNQSRGLPFRPKEILEKIEEAAHAL